MNPDTGHLIALQREEKLPAGYEQLRGKWIERLAQQELAGRQGTHVNLKASTPLAVWAKKKRLAKIAAKSRRRNRK